MKRNFRMLILIYFVIFFGCKKESIVSPNKEPLSIPMVGITSQSKTYHNTYSLFVPGTNTPFIVIPDSLKGKIHFPDSLSQQGIFSYTDEVDIVSERGDTLLINQTEEGFNLYSEILNRGLNNIYSDGSFSSFYTAKYKISDNKVFDVSSSVDSFKILIYDLPLIKGKSYSGRFGYLVYSVLDEVEISTKAGTFITFKIQIVNKDNSDTETRYVNTKYGIILSESRGYRTASQPDTTSNLKSVEYYDRRELVLIK